MAIFLAYPLYFVKVLKKNGKYVFCLMIFYQICGLKYFKYGMSGISDYRQGGR